MYRQFLGGFYTKKEGDIKEKMRFVCMKRECEKNIQKSGIFCM